MHQDLVKAKIQASLLINRLAEVISGDTVITDIQFRAIKLLLDKVLSDAPRDMKVTGEVHHTLERMIVAAHEADSERIPPSH